MNADSILVLLQQHCADLGVMVEYVDLGVARHGEYYHPDLIRLNVRNRSDQMISALAHELGHAIACEDGHSAHCPRADEYGAALVIDEDTYAAAEALVGEHAGALARHLGVTRRLILAWRRWYVRTHAPLEQHADWSP